MKSSKVYVGGTLTMSAGVGIAVFPIQKGGKFSVVLLESGKVVKMTGSRINGLGVPKYLESLGFSLAGPNDPRAEQLAEQLDLAEGLSLVQNASQVRAKQLQEVFAGMECTYVPFDGQDARKVVVLEPQGFYTVMGDLANGISGGTVQIAADICSDTIALHKGWLVGPNGEPDAMPKVSEYGELIERAVYTVCNSGLGTLVGTPNLMPPAEANVPEDLFARGGMKFACDNGGIVMVGANAVDELVVAYFRQGNLLYTRSGVEACRLGDAVATIAAVLVRVGELDAVAKKGKKAA